MNIPRRAAVVVLGAVGLVLYLWPALRAPVVLWSDSAADLGWARSGAGIVTPVVSTHHPPKPAYILFLRTILALGPDNGASAERRIVVVQSILLWLAIAMSSVLVARRFGPRSGVVLYLALILCARLRDASSAVMSEALTAALLLPLAALLLDPPRRIAGATLLGVASAVLFLVRPNAGGASLVLSAVSLCLAGSARRIVPLTLGFAVLWAPIWLATAIPGDPFRGMAPAFITGSVDYGWTPQHMQPPPEPPPFVQVEKAVANWRATFAQDPADRNRQLAWRAFHALLGTEFYDSDWSPAYARASRVSRILTPLVLLACVSALIAAPFSGRTRAAKTLGLILVGIVVVQSLVLGSLPRLATPFLPALLLFGVVASFGLESTARRAVAVAVFVLLVALVAWQPQWLDWEWGQIERSGIRIAQTIPKGRLPESPPATLHVRVAPLLVPTNARLEVRDPAGKILWATPDSGWDEKPFLTVPLTPTLLAANRDGPVELTLVSTGVYGPTHFLLFPLVPPPWRPRARREASAELSPTSGIREESLDWWAHSGTR